MSLYEYSKWDGSQVFQPQSADKVFDRIMEHMLHHGEQVLRHLDDLDDDEVTDVLDLIQKEGLIEQDGEGPLAGDSQGPPQSAGLGPHEPFPDLSARRHRQA